MICTIHYVRCLPGTYSVALSGFKAYKALWKLLRA